MCDCLSKIQKAPAQVHDNGAVDGDVVGHIKGAIWCANIDAHDDAICCLLVHHWESKDGKLIVGKEGTHNESAVIVKYCPFCGEKRNVPFPDDVLAIYRTRANKEG